MKLWRKYNRYDAWCILFCVPAVGSAVIGYYSFVIWPFPHPTILGYHLVWWWLGLAFALLLVASVFLYKAETQY